MLNKKILFISLVFIILTSFAFAQVVTKEDKKIIPTIDVITDTATKKVLSDNKISSILYDSYCKETVCYIISEDHKSYVYPYYSNLTDDINKQNILNKIVKDKSDKISSSTIISTKEKILIK